MIDVIQIYKSHLRIKKPDYNKQTRKNLENWQESFVSKTGYLKDHTLCLPIETKEEPGLKSANLVLIQDINRFDPFLITKSHDNPTKPNWFKATGLNHVPSSHRPSRFCDFEIFRIEKNSETVFSIYLKYSANKIHIGLPERDNHKVAELKLHKPIRYRINGKSDFTMSGRQQRTFVEYDYVFDYLGRADKLEVKTLNNIAMLKAIPFEKCKLVDERNILR